MVLLANKDLGNVRKMGKKKWRNRHEIDLARREQEGDFI